MIRRAFLGLVGTISILALQAACASSGPSAAAAATTIDHDLLDVTVPQLHKFYADKKYTVTQVVKWHLDRIDRYNAVYGAIEQLFRTDALDEATQQDADANGAQHGALWGVPI